MKIGTQDQAFFPSDFLEKFRYLKEMGFDGFEVDGKILLEHFEEIKAAKEKTGLLISSSCNGYEGWIGDTDSEKREKAIREISLILDKLSQIGGTGIVVPAAWGLWSYPHFVAFPRTKEEDFSVVSNALQRLNKVAQKTGTKIYLEPLNRYQDHMINTLSESKKYIVENELDHVQIIADFYHMNQEESNISESLREHSGYIGHIHIADNHRYAPGTGSIAFNEHLKTLEEIGYDGWLVYECLMREDDKDLTYRASLAFIKEQLRKEPKHN